MTAASSVNQFGLVTSYSLHASLLQRPHRKSVAEPITRETKFAISTWPDCERWIPSIVAPGVPITLEK